MPPARIAYVGDSGIDMRTATAAGMLAVGVSWGFRAADELVADGARVVLDHPLDLLELRRQAGGRQSGGRQSGDRRD